ncbi:MAG: PfkB family carbohydrate kinase [Oscillospiraceae bacterium]
MNLKPQCVIVGYAGIDRVIEVESFEDKAKTAIVLNKNNRNVYFGGNGSNIAYCLAKLGCGAYPIMRVGEDQDELGYIEHFGNAGVLTDGITIVKGETTSICHLIKDKNNNHLTMSYPGAMNVKYATEAYDDKVFEQADYGIISVSTYADTVQFLQKCRQHKLPMVLAMRVDYESFPHVILKDILYESKIIFTNEVERKLIEKDYFLADITMLMVLGNAEIIVTTLGEKGCVVYEKKENAIEEVHVAITPCEKVVDTTGAGDSFISGFMYGLLNGEPVEKCAEYASTTSSFIIEKSGCITNAPTQQEMLQRNKVRKY